MFGVYCGLAKSLDHFLFDNKAVKALTACNECYRNTNSQFFVSQLKESNTIISTKHMYDIFKTFH